MYKFSNGVVVFDEETKNEYLKAGFRIIEEPKKEEKIVENSNNNRTIKKEFGTSKISNK